MTEVRTSPPNSIVFVCDPTFPADIPDDIGKGLVWFTPSCVAIGSLAEMDGETTIRLCSSIDHPVGQIVFEGNLATPGRLVAVSTAHNDLLLSMPMESKLTRLTIWANHPTEPELILVQAVPAPTSGS